MKKKFSIQLTTKDGTKVVFDVKADSPEEARVLVKQYLQELLSTI